MRTLTCFVATTVAGGDIGVVGALLAAGVWRSWRDGVVTPLRCFPQRDEEGARY